MVSFKTLLSLAPAASLTLAAPSWPPKPGCGDLDIIFTYACLPLSLFEYPSRTVQERQTLMGDIAVAYHHTIPWSRRRASTRQPLMPRYEGTPPISSKPGITCEVCPAGLLRPSIPLPPRPGSLWMPWCPIALLGLPFFQGD